MERPEAPTRPETGRPRVARDAQPLVDVHDPNFGLLASDASWRTSWSAIIAGRFTSSPHSGLLFVEHSTGFAELYETDGGGRIRAPFVRQYSPLGDRATWTQIVSGVFGPSGLTGLLLYDRAAGVGEIYDNTGNGDFVRRRHYEGWRTSWTHIVTGRFVSSSPYSAVFFYSASENYAEIWATDGQGHIGTTPWQTFRDFSERRFTHVLAGEFHWTPGYIDVVPTLHDLFFYDAVAGYGEMYRSDHPAGEARSRVVLDRAAASDALPRHVTGVVAGNFGGLGNTDLAFYDSSTGTIGFYAFRDTSDTTADIVLRETQSGLRRSPTTLLVAGHFSMANPDDHWFNDGPVVAGAPAFDPNWRHGTGAFSDLLIYDRAAGVGECYFHEPIDPPSEPLEGYITSRSVHRGEAPFSSGSVLPGESIAFHVSSQRGPYSITIYRQGLTEQPMATVEGLPSAPTPFRIARNAYKDGAGWPAVATFVVPEWPSGVYLARVETIRSPKHTIDLPFVVRARDGSASGILLVLADTTYQAYNDWGGRNSYGHLSGADFVGAFPSTSALRIPYGFHLAFDRPFHGGFGNALQTWEIPFIQWLSRRGIPVDVCTSRDLHVEPPDSDRDRLLLFVGHHEYWTAEMRTHVERFAKSGGNVAFFSGNVCWWQIRLSDDGTELRCYKVAGFDPVSGTSDHERTTVHWFDDLVKRPETALTGVSWLGEGGLYYDQDHRFTVTRADHWVFANTGLTNGATFGGYSSVPNGVEDRSVAGAESDRVQDGGPNGLTSPPDFGVARILDLSGSFEVGTMGTFTAEGGTGVVFNAPTLNWALGLNHDENSWNVIDQITLNVVSRLGPISAGPWASVSEGSTVPGGSLTAVVTAPGRISLFVADSAGGVFTTSGNPDSGWRPWASVSEGATTPGGKITAVALGANRVALFLADPGGGVFTASGRADGGWGPWRSVSEGSTLPGAQVSAVVMGSNRIALFLADAGGSVFTTVGSPDGPWGPWRSVSEGVTTPGGDVTALAVAPNRIALFLADPGGGVFTTSGNPDAGWGPWRSVSEGATTPGALITAIGSNRVALFLADPGGGVFTTSGSPDTGWGPWQSVADGATTPGAPITAVAMAPNGLALCLADRAGGVHATSGSADRGWLRWRTVSEGRSTPGARVMAVSVARNQASLFVVDPAGGIYAASLTLGA
jgi:hypothetical protein